ncbi:Flagellar motor component A MotA [Thiovulum sp. ES]|nr:Flagellar motor component A MotA [Thiovulum sp. ES]
MDLGTVIGLVLIYVLLAISMMLGVGIGPYVNIPSVLIVVGGSIGAIMVGFKMEQVTSMFGFFMIAIKPPVIDMDGLIKKLIDFAVVARKEGILSLEAPLKNEENKFLQMGLMMAIDGQEPDVIRDLLEIEIEQTSTRHKGNISMFDQLAALAGAMGMVGTLIGLVAMLLNMSDPSAIGPAMAVALLTTLYGSVIGNTFGTPIANILSVRNDEETLQNQMLLEGIISIQSGDNPRNMEAKLLGFVPPSKRKSQFDS